MNQWINESVNHGTTESTNQGTNESMNFANLVLQKCYDLVRFLAIWMQIENLAIESRAVQCTFCRPFAQIEAREPRKQRPYFGDPRSHITRKNNGFRARERFTHEFTRFRTLTLPNYLMMSGWHDDVRDMMAWLLTMTIVCNSEVF